MKSMLFFGLVFSCLVAADEAFAKKLTIFNDTTLGVDAMDVETDDPVSHQKKPKKNIPVGIAAAPGQVKNNGKDKPSGKEVIVDLADGECFADVTFKMGDGKQFVQRNVDLCGLDGIIVVVPPDQPQLTAAP